MTATDFGALREQIVTTRGLAADTARFLTGTTVSELESSADALALLLLDANAQQEQTATVAPDPIIRAMREKQKRKQALADLFTGRTPQPRDEQGRFTKTASFDGGARASVPLPPPTHASGWPM